VGWRHCAAPAFCLPRFAVDDKREIAQLRQAEAWFAAAAAAAFERIDAGAGTEEDWRAIAPSATAAGTAPPRLTGPRNTQTNQDAARAFAAEGALSISQLESITLRCVSLPPARRSFPISYL
jgi:hypothetical protein